MLLPIFVCLALLVAPWDAASALEQEPSPEHGLRLSLAKPGLSLSVATHQELQKKIGSEAETRTIIREAIERGVVVRPGDLSAGSSRVVSVVAEQLPEAWIPRIEGVRFERVSFAEVLVGWRERCLELLLVGVSVTETTLTVSLSRANRCRSVALERQFDRTPTGWTISPGVGGGVVGGGSDCLCK
jgi:hypothetical protein